MMHWLKWGIRIALAVLLLLDVSLFVQIRRHGWPSTATMKQIGPETFDIRVTQLPITLADWAIICGLLMMHAALIYLLWRFRRPVRA
jgi:hypothetical protein